MTKESTAPSDSPPETWLNAIAGRTTTGQSPIEEKEVGRLRLAMRELDEEAVANSKLDLDWQQLRFRLRREGLAGNRRQPSGVYWALAATLVLTASIGYLWAPNQPDAPESTVMRGKPGFVKVLRTDMPEALTENILSACNQSHVTCSQIEDASGALVVNMAMMKPAPQGFEEALQALGIDELPAGEKITLIVTRRK